MAWVNVDVDLGEFSDEELREELESRGYGAPDKQLLQKIYEAHQMNQNYDDLLAKLIWDTIGKVW